MIAKIAEFPKFTEITNDSDLVKIATLDKNAKNAKLP